MRSEALQHKIEVTHLWVDLTCPEGKNKLHDQVAPTLIQPVSVAYIFNQSIAVTSERLLFGFFFMPKSNKEQTTTEEISQHVKEVSVHLDSFLRINKTDSYMSPALYFCSWIVDSHNIPSNHFQMQILLPQLTSLSDCLPLPPSQSEKPTSVFTTRH